MKIERFYGLKQHNAQNKNIKGPVSLFNSYK